MLESHLEQKKPDYTQQYLPSNDFSSHTKEGDEWTSVQQHQEGDFFFFLYRTTALQQVNPREGPSLATTVTFQFCSNINAPETAAE